MSKGKKKRRQPAPDAGQRVEPAAEAPAEIAPEAELNEAQAEPEADEAALKAEHRAKLHKRHMKALRGLIIRVLLLALVVYILFFHIIGVTIMPNSDMSPRLDAGDLLLFYRINPEPKIQDIAVIRREETGKKYVCRVIAAPGDTVEITDERGLSVNGNTLSEPYIFYATRPYEGFDEYPVTLGDGEYFVLSDYRNGGEDSRYFGPVSRSEIQGIVITVLRRNNL